jgi:tRNA pseudouridine55 synthase
MTEDFEGILLVDKPQGFTSHDVVAKCRKIFQIKKIGHAGTLDPMATGLLVILVGKATKQYTGTVYFGKETDSQDADGEIIKESPVPELNEAIVKEKMAEFIGDQYQIPPMFSAKKVGGKKLYQLARAGKTIEREPRVIRIGRFDLLNLESPKMDFIVDSSKGAYIRTIAHDLGGKFGCGGHLCELRRTKVGSFLIENAETLESLEKFTKSKLKSKLLPIKEYIPSHAF